MSKRKTIYTMGYQGWTPAAFCRAVRARDGLLVDVRYAARSRNRAWTKSALLEEFGERYLHVRDLGNVNYRAVGRPIEIADLEAGAKTVESLLTMVPGALILLCACKDVATCHRKVVADALAERFGMDVEHIEPPAEPPGLFD